MLLEFCTVVYAFVLWTVIRKEIDFVMYLLKRDSKLERSTSA